MFLEKVVAICIPAYNEESQISSVLQLMPEWVDHLVVINDASSDNTANVVRTISKQDSRVKLIDLDSNKGVGGALAEGFFYCRTIDADVVVTVDGDGQMDLTELESLVGPIARDEADYVKGNRFIGVTSWGEIPKIRLIGNATLSLLTKIASGYWGISDFQSGYTAISKQMLLSVRWEDVYPRYGRPNDVIVQANLLNLRVMDVPIKALYGVGEKSTMKIRKVVFPIMKLLFFRFWQRLWRKYVVLDFHPLVFFYLYSVFSGALSAVLGVRFAYVWFTSGNVPLITSLGLAITFTTFLNSIFFAFWMDMLANDHLVIRQSKSKN